MSADRCMLVALVALLAVSGAYAGRGASMRNLQADTPAKQPQDLHALYAKQVDELAEMISSVFLVHSGSNLQAFPTLNVTDVILATEMSIESFFQQVVGYITGTIELVTNLPSELAAFPGQLAEAADPANQPDPTQLTNGTYLQEQFETLVEGLEHPVAVGGGGSVFSYNPCYINLAPGGVQAFATGVGISPSLAVITPEGVNIQPQGLNIQPVLITIFPVGVNVQPQGLNIAPALIAVTPGRVSINPQGGTIGPALISVAAASP